MSQQTEAKAQPRTKGRLKAFGCWVSEKVADLSADPFAQLGFIILCVIWFLVGFRVDIITAILSILAITLTQMVLNRQAERERDAHRRDVALHAKLDEILHASKRARDELAGIEELEEEEIEALKQAVGNVAAFKPASGLDVAMRQRRASSGISR
jgi:low affinity Fe/Cu permease